MLWRQIRASLLTTIAEKESKGSKALYRAFRISGVMGGVSREIGMGGVSEMAPNGKLRSRCERLAKNQVLSVGPQKGLATGPHRSTHGAYISGAFREWENCSGR